MSTEPVVAAPPGNRRFPLFDSLRAIAVLAVLLSHVTFVTGANFDTWYGAYTARLDIGVTIFFLISGFLIYRPFVAARLAGAPPQRPLNFFRKRALRILPAYWLAITILAIYPGLPEMFGPHTWVYYSFLQIYYSKWFGGLVSAWSLCVEVSFYLVLPGLAWLLLRRPGTKRQIVRNELVVLGSIYVLSVVAGVLSAAGDLGHNNLQVMLPTQFNLFALGMGLAVASVALEHRDREPLDHQPWLLRLVVRRPTLCWIAAAVLYWILASQLTHAHRFGEPLSVGDWLSTHVVYGLIAFLLILPAVFGDTAGGFARAVLRNRVLSWLGLISYGIFLWHLPIVGRLAKPDATKLWPHSQVIGVGLTTLVLAVACAAASYYVLERPILRYKYRRPERPVPAPRPAAVPDAAPARVQGGSG